jgi:aminodeoxyfutalosine deaminase
MGFAESGAQQTAAERLGAGRPEEMSSGQRLERLLGIPKAELHVHLEGSIEPATLREIDPSLSLAEIEAHTKYEDFAGFLRAYVWVNRRLETPEHYALALRRLASTLQAQGVVYAEITLSAGVILWKGQDLEAIYDALWEETQRAPIEIRWILDAIRQFGAAAARPVVAFAGRARERGVVAFGIGGDEVRGPAREFADVFREARQAGLRLTCHAGETAGPESVREALAIGAERIGHGIAAIQDEALMAELRERAIPLEVCVTSNVRTGVVASAGAHPLRRLYEAGVPVLLNTDDPALFGCTLIGEYEQAAGLGFREEELEELAGASLRFAFAGPGGRG